MVSLNLAAHCGKFAVYRLPLSSLMPTYQEFKFGLHLIRVVVYEEVRYFVGNDVASALGYADPSVMIYRHCKMNRVCLNGATLRSLGMTKCPPKGYVLITTEAVQHLMFKSTLDTRQFAEWFTQLLVTMN